MQLAAHAQPLKVLFVEDDNDYVELFKAATEDDLELTVVKTIHDAEVRALSEDFDLTLLDLTLPDDPSAPGGVDTVRAARQRVPEPVVVLTGGDDLDPAAARAAGAREWVSKDVHPRLVARILRVALACEGLVRTWEKATAGA